MPDQFSEVKQIGWGQNIKKALSGFVFGLILFIGSFVLLWINEGKVDLSKVAKSAAEIKADVLNQNVSLEGKLVSTTGPFATDETAIGDDLYFPAGNYIAVQRKVEMYAWEEKKETESKEKLGGGTEETTTYTYEKVWTEDPEDSSQFKYPEEHQNPNKAITSSTKTVASAKVGVYAVNMDKLTLPDFETVPPPEVTDPEIKKQEDYLYRSADPTNPQIGDLRISYSVIANNIEVTLFGRLDQDKINPYVYKDSQTLYRAFLGSRDEAISTMHTEYLFMLWALRFLGFLMMWIGLGLFFGPIIAILKVVPFLGALGRGITGFVTFIAALVLTLLTIVISKIAHNVWALIAVIVVVLALAFYFARLRAKKKIPPAPATPTPPVAPGA